VWSRLWLLGGSSWAFGSGGLMDERIRRLLGERGDSILSASFSLCLLSSCFWSDVFQERLELNRVLRAVSRKDNFYIQYFGLH
jgi:hypothetical protein